VIEVKKKIIMCMVLMALMVTGMTMVNGLEIKGLKWMDAIRGGVIGLLDEPHTFTVMGSTNSLEFYYRVMAEDAPPFPVYAGFLSHDETLTAQGGMKVEFRGKAFVTFNKKNGEVIGGTLKSPGLFQVRVPELDRLQPKRWKLLNVKFTPGTNCQPITFYSANDEETKQKITLVDCGTLAEDTDLPNAKGVTATWNAGAPIYVNGRGVTRGQKSIYMVRHFNFFEEVDKAGK
jgi:hypothetical protein